MLVLCFKSPFSIFYLPLLSLLILSWILSVHADRLKGKQSSGAPIPNIFA